MKIKHLIVNEVHSFGDEWRIVRADWDEISRGYHVLLYKEEDSIASNGILGKAVPCSGFELSPDNNS